MDFKKSILNSHDWHAILAFSIFPNFAMPQPLPDGLYDQILTDDLVAELAESTNVDHYSVAPLEAANSTRRLADALAGQLANLLQEIAPREVGDVEAEHRTVRLQSQLEFVNSMLVDLRKRLADDYPDKDYGANIRLLASPARNLVGVHRERTKFTPPDTGVTSPWLFTAAKGSPALLSELRHELATSDRIDILMSFITVSGIRKIRDILQSITAIDGTGRARCKLRILTTTYIGATEAQAVDELARLPNCEVRISLDGRRTRLHAKAWIFERDSGFGTAYVGSANLTQAALAGGLEWTVKFTERGQSEMFQQAQAHFETLWYDTEFVSYDPAQAEHRAALQQAIAKEKGANLSDQPSNAVRFFDLAPKNYQLEMLEQLQAERGHGRARNLIVAATGTGKTVVAAFDYRRMCSELGGRPRLLFIAHRIEILQQALRTYREVLRDNSFGQVLSGKNRLDSPDHLFTTIESLHSNELLERYGATYWHTVVFDECHRIAAASFDAVAKRVKPAILLGLTATPERSDGRPIASYFDCRPDGSPAVELRLWQALDLQLLAPFEYFACDDSTDLRTVPWRQPGEGAFLDKVLSNDHVRARTIINEWRRLCVDPTKSKAIAFCVSVAHAEFMTAQFNMVGIPALCLTGQTPPAERDAAPRLLAAGTVCVLVTVDLFNEGVDIPVVDTLLLLRPTQSAVLFQQQIGRGLRLWNGKESCLILDFVGQHSVEYRFDHLLGTITGLNRRQLIEEVEKGFSHLPAGCHIQLQKRSREQILANLRKLIQQNWRRMTAELLAYASLKGRQNVSLANFLHDQALNVQDVYRSAGNSGWTSLRRAAGFMVAEAGPEEEYFGHRLAALLHVNDPEQLALMGKVVSLPINDLNPESKEALRVQMLAYQVDGTANRIGSGPDFLQRLKDNENIADELAQLARVLEANALPDARPIPGLEWAPLCLHAHYRLNEILTSVGFLTASKRPFFNTGVLRLKERQVELMFVTLDKREGFHESIAYHDYAVSHDLFHWQSQNSTAPTTSIGQQYIRSVGDRPNGWSFQLFVRIDPDSPYLACGPATFQSSHGERPMNITWKLKVKLPAAAFSQFSVLRTA
jgi:superfamily II DNA or RNA helicase/HKD family nuclease